MMKFLRDCYEYRYMIFNLIKRDIRGRYKGSILGFFWNIIVPMTTMLVYTAVFSVLLHNSIDQFAIFLITAMAPWLYFSECLSAGTGNIIAYSSMIEKIYFPKSVLCVSTVLSRAFNFLITLCIVAIIIAVLGWGFSPIALLFLPLAIVLLTVFTTGLLMLLSSINAYYRDVEYLVGVVLTVMYWLTPIVYSRDQFSSSLLDAILTLNPASYFTDMFRDILYYQTVPDISLIIICTILAFGFLIVGIYVFHRLEKNFAEVI